ncbi:MAG: hypothetical protein AAFN79_05635 [Pseudomonadota bacterium]
MNLHLDKIIPSVVSGIIVLFVTLYFQGDSVRSSEIQSYRQDININGKVIAESFTRSFSQFAPLRLDTETGESDYDKELFADVIKDTRVFDVRVAKFLVENQSDSATIPVEIELHGAEYAVYRNKWIGGPDTEEKIIYPNRPVSTRMPAGDKIEIYVVGSALTIEPISITAADGIVSIDRIISIDEVRSGYWIDQLKWQIVVLSIIGALTLFTILASVVEQIFKSMGFQSGKKEQKEIEKDDEPGNKEDE